MVKKIAVFTGKLFLLFLLLELALRLGGAGLLDGYAFRHKAERLPWWVKDLPTMVKMHRLAGPKTDDEIRVVLLGNSAVYGGYIPAKSALAAQLEEYLNQSRLRGKVKIYNLAVNGAYALEDFLIAHEALKYRPDVIVWGITLRDFYNPAALNQSPLAGFNLLYLENLQGWYVDNGYRPLYELYGESYKQDRRNHLQKLAQAVSKHWHLFRYRELLREMTIDWFLSLLPAGLTKEAVNHYEGTPRLFTLTPQQRLFKEKDFSFPNPNYLYVKVMSDLLHQKQVELVLFNQPVFTPNNAYPHEYYEKYRQDFFKDLTPWGNRSMDLADSLASTNDIFYDIMHLTPQGNKALALELYPVLESYLGTVKVSKDYRK